MNWSGVGGAELARPGGCDVLPGPRSRESRRDQRSRRNPLLQAKLKMAGQACVSPQLSQSAFPLELASAAGVALQQPDDGRVTLGTFDEFFQR